MVSPPPASRTSLLPLLLLLLLTSLFLIPALWSLPSPKSLWSSLVSSITTFLLWTLGIVALVLLAVLAVVVGDWWYEWMYGSSSSQSRRRTNGPGEGEGEGEEAPEADEDSTWLTSRNKHPSLKPGQSFHEGVTERLWRRTERRARNFVGELKGDRKGGFGRGHADEVELVDLAVAGTSGGGGGGVGGGERLRRRNVPPSL